MHVLATAGHVDAGKSALVRALTGMEPDRWAQERRRGMTIDLGYVWTDLPSGATVAFVDVPGHQRFIANMLAGLGPSPAVLFVVAADAGWQAQSHEHLAAVQALGLRHAVLAVTRSDLADPEPAMQDGSRRLTDAGLGAAETVAVSGRTGAGLDQLRSALDRLVAGLPAPDPAARVRFWVDRSFTIKGSGTVVTGTLSAGTIRVGDTLDLRGRQVVVRGVQSLERPLPSAGAVARVALNLRAVAPEEVMRGEALLGDLPWHRTDLADVRLLRAPDRPLAAELMLHVGTAGIAVRTRPLGADLVRLRLAKPLPLLVGDRAVLRDPGAQDIVSGVLVLDTDPPVLRRRGAAARRAVELAGVDGRPDPAAEVRRRGAVQHGRLHALGLPELDSRPADIEAVAGWLVTHDVLAGWARSLAAAVHERAAAMPLDPWLSIVAARRASGLPDANLVAAIADRAGVRVDGGRVGPLGVVADLGAAAAGLVALEARLGDSPFLAPQQPELSALGLGTRELAAAERAGRLLRLPDGVVLLPTALDRAVEVLAELDQPFTMSAAREALGTTRRVAVPLLEYLDAHGRTRRLDSGHRALVVR